VNCYTTSLLLEVFTERNFVADFIRLKLNLIKKQKIVFEQLVGGTMGLRTHSI